jgi:hypothetical protein
MEEPEVIERVRAQSQRVEKALLEIMGASPDEAGDPDWVTVPVRLPTDLAALLALMGEAGEVGIRELYANVLLRGLWALGSEGGMDTVARAAAMLIYKGASAPTWDAWSARHPQARKYVAEEIKNDEQATGEG